LEEYTYIEIEIQCLRREQNLYTNILARSVEFKFIRLLIILGTLWFGAHFIRPLLPMFTRYSDILNLTQNITYLLVHKIFIFIVIFLSIHILNPLFATSKSKIFKVITQFWFLAAVVYSISTLLSVLNLSNTFQLRFLTAILVMYFIKAKFRIRNLKDFIKKVKQSRKYLNATEILSTGVFALLLTRVFVSPITSTDSILH
jgi:hypothetical protein